MTKYDVKMAKDCKPHNSAKSFSMILFIFNLILIVMLAIHTFEVADIHNDEVRIEKKVNLLLDEAGVTYDASQDTE